MPTPNDYSREGENNSGGGEFGSARGQDEGGRLGNTAEVPAPAQNPRIFSSKEGNPEALLDSTRPGIEAHADQQYAYGLCSPVATQGSHPWLRDSLADPGQKQPGNETPHYTAQIARRITED